MLMSGTTGVIVETVRFDRKIFNIIDIQLIVCLLSIILRPHAIEDTNSQECSNIIVYPVPINYFPFIDRNFHPT